MPCGLCSQRLRRGRIWMVASCWLLVSGYAAGLPACFYRKDAKEARLAPSETDQPRFLHSQESTASVVLTRLGTSLPSQGA